MPPLCLSVCEPLFSSLSPNSDFSSHNCVLAFLSGFPNLLIVYTSRFNENYFHEFHLKSGLSFPVELSENWEQLWLRSVSYHVYYGQQCFGDLLAIAFPPQCKAGLGTDRI